MIKKDTHDDNIFLFLTKIVKKLPVKLNAKSQKNLRNIIYDDRERKGERGRERKRDFLISYFILLNIH